jgi:hypothetical protein
LGFRIVSDSWGCKLLLAWPSTAFPCAGDFHDFSRKQKPGLRLSLDVGFKDRGINHRDASCDLSAGKFIKLTHVLHLGKTISALYSKVSTFHKAMAHM